MFCSYLIVLCNILQALNNLGSIYVDCGKLELAKECYKNALAIRHTRAHQGLARVYHGTILWSKVSPHCSENVHVGEYLAHYQWTFLRTNAERHC